ncbi:hypothetical protein ACGFZK_26885 [Streptomyces sp. NPDC048257]|uniref:hypothetical protein n=1 Tax=Streptomyces sp. NPDC048257 TaxID=3365526 RepID=UPI00371231D4
MTDRPRELAALLRENAGHPWKPPAAGPTGVFAHDVVHGLDITVAVGHERGVDLTGIQLRAQDLDWPHGEGTRLNACASTCCSSSSAAACPRVG